MDRAMHSLHILLLIKNKGNLSAACPRALINTHRSSTAPALSQGCLQPLWPQDLFNSCANAPNASPQWGLSADILHVVVIYCSPQTTAEALKLLALTRYWGNTFWNTFWPQQKAEKEKKKKSSSVQWCLKQQQLTTMASSICKGAGCQKKTLLLSRKMILTEQAIVISLKNRLLNSLYSP